MTSNSISNFAAVVNTHSSYHDVLDIFLRTFHRHCPNLKLYVFTDRYDDKMFSKNETVIVYQGETFRDQYLYGLSHVAENILLTLNDDYFLISDPDWEEIKRCIDLLKATDYAQLRLHRGPNFINKTEAKSLFHLDLNSDFFYSQTVTLWKTSALIDVFRGTPPSGIARKGKEIQFEVIANETCRKLGLTGLVYYNHERKRGRFHFDCTIFPYISSAIVDGRWNFIEYSKELEKIGESFDHDFEVRGKNSNYIFRFFNFLNQINTRFKNLLSRTLKRY